MKEINRLSIAVTSPFGIKKGENVEAIYKSKGMESYTLFKLYMIHSNIQNVYTIGENMSANFNYNPLLYEKTPILSGSMRNISFEEVGKMMSEWIHSK